MAVNPGMFGLTSTPAGRFGAAMHGRGNLAPGMGFPTEARREGPPPGASPLTVPEAFSRNTRRERHPGQPDTTPGTAQGGGAAIQAPSVASSADQQRLAELAYSCLLGDPYAWEALVRSQQRRVYALCYRFTGSPTEAEDLTQEVFLKVYRNLRSFDPGRASFGVWLTTLTRNLLVDHYRRSRMERLSESLDQSSTGEDDGPTRAERLADPRGGQEKHVAGVELRAKIQAALTKVSPELREAVILRDLEDMDYKDIAETLCIPQGTVKSRISRGRAELARLLKGMEGQVV